MSGQCDLPGNLSLCLRVVHEEYHPIDGRKQELADDP